MNYDLRIKNKKRSGFTLIELLVTISLIGILASLAAVSYAAAQKQARDTQRKSDLKQYQTALEQYANKNNGLYISSGGVTVLPSGATYCGAFGMTTCPDDPKTPDQDYSLQTDGTVVGTGTATKYALWAKLDNMDNTYWVVCSNGRSGNLTGAPSPTDGACPI